MIIWAYRFIYSESLLLSIISFLQPSSALRSHHTLPRVRQEQRFRVRRHEPTREVVVGMHQGPNTQDSDQAESGVEYIFEHGINHRSVVFRPEIKVLKIMTESGVGSRHKTPRLTSSHSPRDDLRRSAQNHLTRRGNWIQSTKKWVEEQNESTHLNRVIPHRIRRLIEMKERFDGTRYYQQRRPKNFQACECMDPWSF